MIKFWMKNNIAIEFYDEKLNFDAGRFGTTATTKFFDSFDLGK